MLKDVLAFEHNAQETLMRQRECYTTKSIGRKLNVPCHTVTDDNRSLIAKYLR